MRLSYNRVRNAVAGCVRYQSADVVELVDTLS